MKKLTCEMCGNTDFIKQDGVFVCQYCGIKYSVEEAKKMMNDENDNLSGYDKTEKNIELDNLLILAERALNEENYQSAEKYYDDILRMDPNNWYANFFRSYCNTMQSRIINLVSNYSITVNTAYSTIKMLIEQGNLDFLEAYKTIHNKLCELACIVIYNKGNIYIQFPEKVIRMDEYGIVDMQNEDGFSNFIQDLNDVILPILALQSVILESDFVTIDIVNNIEEKMNAIVA